MSKVRSHSSRVWNLQSSLVLGITLAMAASVTGCTSQEEMLKDANCEGQVLTIREDGQKILEMAPDGIDQFTSAFDESDFGGYRAHCGVRDREREEKPAIVLDATYLTDATDPAKLPVDELAGPFNVQGRLLRIASDAPHVAGASGDGDASLRAPCAMSNSDKLPPDMREGVMAVAAWSEDAPDSDSLKQRQNAADLALSFLRHAAQKCDDPPKLPNSVEVRE